MDSSLFDCVLAQLLVSDPNIHMWIRHKGFLTWRLFSFVLMWDKFPRNYHCTDGALLWKQIHEGFCYFCWVCRQCLWTYHFVHTGRSARAQDYHRLNIVFDLHGCNPYISFHIVLTLGVHKDILPLLYIGQILMGFGGFALSMVSYSYLSEINNDKWRQKSLVLTYSFWYIFCNKGQLEKCCYIQ